MERPCRLFSTKKESQQGTRRVAYSQQRGKANKRQHMLLILNKMIKTIKVKNVLLILNNIEVVPTILPYNPAIIILIERKEKIDLSKL